MINRLRNWIKKITQPNTLFDELRLVISTTENHLASIYKLKLEEEGIPVFVIDKRDSSYNAFGEIEMYVHHTNLLKAKHLIEKDNE